MSYADGTTLDGTYGFSAVGLLGDDAIDSVTLGTNATTSTSSNWNAGSWTITSSTAVGANFNASNYSITYTNGALTVGQVELTVSGVSGTNKIYDGTTSDTITGSASLSGVVSGDTVTLNTGSATASFASASVGNGKPVTFAGYTISGTDSGNYTLTQPTSSANISPHWFDDFTESGNTGVASHTPDTGSGGYTNIGGGGSVGNITGGTPGWYAGGMGNGIFGFDPGGTVSSMTMTFVWQSSMVIAFNWDGRGIMQIYGNQLLVSAGSHLSNPSLSLVAGTSYTVTLTDDGTNVSAILNGVTASISDSASTTGTTCSMQITTSSVDPTALITSIEID
jgi:hypothetical protein